MKTKVYVKSPNRWCRLVTASFLLILASACASLRPEDAPQTPSFYSLDDARLTASSGPADVRRAVADAAPTLIVSVPRAVAGFDSKRLIYVRQSHTREYFSHSEWIDTPARMLSPLIVTTLERTQMFRSVVRSPGSASGELRLDTEIVLLQHEFDVMPSRVRFILRAGLIDDATRQPIATREFESVVIASSDDPYGGVLAANQAVQNVLKKMADFCVTAAESGRRGQERR